MDDPRPQVPVDGRNKKAISGQQQVTQFQDQKTAEPTMVRPAGAKEKEAVGEAKAEITIEEVPQEEIVVSKEAKEVGIEVKPETPEVPPDLKKLGVRPSGPTQPVIHQGTDQTGFKATTISLPISDDQVVVGLHANILSSLRWLAEWCFRRLKRAHLVLKTIHGKVKRVRTR